MKVKMLYKEKNEVTIRKKMQIRLLKNVKKCQKKLLQKLLNYQ